MEHKLLIFLLCDQMHLRLSILINLALKSTKGMDLTCPCGPGDPSLAECPVLRPGPCQMKEGDNQITAQSVASVRHLIISFL